ncbi:hypothetical protein C5167_033283 [Papaver somniferum]|uniref:DJ-1/PfpI domain-containing protein n=1 Tax=Papaver somniferum TaxID=3469 RepID=A0A4Y7KBH7_PAPSO|nr:hypothetical protein C5167_033283 [Papaver somniferum]
MEEFEAKVPFQALQAYGFTVDAVFPGKKAGCPNKKAGESCITIIREFESGAQTYSARPGYSFHLTETFEALNSSSYDALVVPGGQAPEYLSLNEDVLNLVKEFTDAGKPVGSMGLSASSDTTTVYITLSASVLTLHGYTYYLMLLPYE